MLHARLAEVAHNIHDLGHPRVRVSVCVCYDLAVRVSKYLPRYYTLTMATVLVADKSGHTASPEVSLSLPPPPNAKEAIPLITAVNKNEAGHGTQYYCYKKISRRRPNVQLVSSYKCEHTLTHTRKFGLTQCQRTNAHKSCPFKMYSMP